MQVIVFIKSYRINNGLQMTLRNFSQEWSLLESNTGNVVDLEYPRAQEAGGRTREVVVAFNYEWISNLHRNRQNVGFYILRTVVRSGLKHDICVDASPSPPVILD